MDSLWPPVETERMRRLIHLPVRSNGNGSGEEALRLAALERVQILDSAPQAFYEGIARMAAAACDAPGALVTFVGADRQWSKASHGCEELNVDRSDAFCTRTIEEKSTLVVDDAARDERFMHSPLVTELGIRFYAGVPLVSPEGFGLGSLCVIDYEPRVLTAEQQNMLEELAALIQRDLDVRRASLDIEALIEKHPLPMWIFEIETLRILAVNDYAVQQYGYDREAFLALRLTDLRPSADVPLLLNAISRFNGHSDRLGPWRHLCADGSIIWVEVAVQAVVYDGRPAVLAMVSDITEQVTWKRAHQATDERFRVLVDAVEDYAIILLDPVGRIVSWNPGARRLYGLDDADALGRSSADLFPDEDEKKSAFTGRLQAQLNDGPFRIEARQLRAGTPGFWADILLTPIHADNGRLLGFAQITHDATLRRDHEQKLIEDRERAERLNEITSHHLIQLSRQLRTPLTGIIGTADVLAQQVEGEDAEFVDTIRRNGDSLLEALETAVEFVQLHGALGKPALSELDLDREARATVERFAPRAADLGLSLSVESSGESIKALGHDDLLQRVLGQLVRNALKFTEVGGIVLRTGTDGEEAYIEVRDSGIGMDADFLGRVFEPFAQEDPDYGRMLTGCGLGLPIAHRQMDRMGGSITAESNKGQGSRFTVRLRRA